MINRYKGEYLMKKILLVILILIVFVPVVVGAEILSNPGFQVGKKNLFVGIEYSHSLHEYDLDTNDLATTTERVSLKVTTGLSEWFDIFVKAGGSRLILDYENNNYVYNNLGYASKNFDSDMNIGFGAGGRLRLLNFVDSRTRVYVQGGGYYVKNDGDIEWHGIETFIKEREIKWADLYVGIGVAKRMDFVDLNFGVGFSEIKWWIKDTDVTKVGGIERNRLTKDERDSFESKAPVFGFIGLDFVLPYEYRISAQAGIRNMDDVEFSIAISQGLERD